MGADTYTRLADPKYYGGSSEAMRQAVQRIATEARGLIVFGRERDGAFEDPERLDLPPALRGNVRQQAPFGGRAGAPPHLNPQDVQDIAAFLRTLSDGHVP
jgi:hypothetical protein